MAELAAIPREVEDLLKCPECGRRRIRLAGSDGGWVCPQMKCGRVMYDGTLLHRIGETLPYERDEGVRKGASEAEHVKAANRRAARVKGMLRLLKDLAKREQQ